MLNDGLHPEFAAFIAAIRGNAEAIRLRREIATEMTDAEIAQAQRAARDWN